LWMRVTIVRRLETETNAISQTLEREAFLNKSLKIEYSRFYGKVDLF